MAKHTGGPYQGFSCDGKRLFNELERILQQPSGLGQLFKEFGRRQVCAAILSEEPPYCEITIAQHIANLNAFLADNPEQSHRLFEFGQWRPTDEMPSTQVG